MNCNRENDIKVSICVITYNHQDYIEECLNSLISQKTDFPFEIVIRDDNSTDETFKIIKKYAEEYPKFINLLNSSENLGMNKNFKSVVDSALGEYIAICEGDDFWITTDKIQYQYQQACKNTSVEFFIHACHSVNQKSKIIPQNENRFFGGGADVTFNCHDILSFPGQFAPTSSYFIKSSVLKLLPSWFLEAPIGDVFIELYSTKKYHGFFSPKVMSVYRVESIGSWSDKMKKETPQNKIKYAKVMVSSIEKMKIDFSESGDIFNKKINALNFFSAIAYLNLGNVALFREKISPIDSKHVSKYHKLLDLVKGSVSASNLLVLSYNFVKKVQWQFLKK